MLPPGDWPQRAHSRSLKVGAIDWHLQMAGHGPLILLLHGSGASAHSWSAMLPLLASHAMVLAPDLPGHGYTAGAPYDALTLPRLRESLTALIDALKLPRPTLVVGHSAGAALALRWAVDAPWPPKAVLGFAPSLVAPPLRTMQWLAPFVHPFATSRPVTRLLATLAGPTGFVDMLLDSTGSRLPASQRKAYRHLFSHASHVRGAMSFMAAADLPSLLPACRHLPCAAHFVLGDNDRWIPERPLRALLERTFVQADVQRWPGGHLVHEEAPQRAAKRVLDLLAE
jgi:magnesium chelatase accessory protein